MNITIQNSQIYSPRIASERNVSDRFITYGLDNLYPQKIEQVMLLSPITKSCVNLTSSFIRGDGFERGDKVVNEKGETANDILELISRDQSIFNAYGLHVHSNGLSSVTQIEHVPTEFIRLGLPNRNGQISYVQVSNNWEGWNDEILPDNDERIRRYSLYKKDASGAEAITSGKGMILYATPKMNCYPISTIDAIIETAQTDAELQRFMLGNATNGFLGLNIFKYPSSFDSEDEVKKLQHKLGDLKGGMNSNTTIVVEVDEDYEGGDLIESVPALNNDSLFTNSSRLVIRTILATFNCPASLAGYLPEGSLFSAQQIADDYTAMNLHTKDIRNKIERQFEQLGLDVGKIVPNSFESSLMNDQNGNTTGQPIQQ